MGSLVRPGVSAPFFPSADAGVSSVASPQVFANVHRLDGLLGQGGGVAVHGAWHLQQDGACALNPTSGLPAP